MRLVSKNDYLNINYIYDKKKIMNIIKKINNHFLETSESFFLSNLNKRIKFLIKKKNFFLEISSFINKCVNNSHSILFFVVEIHQ